MNDQRLFVSWTMDCEPIGAEVSTGGPESWALSERAMRGYVRALVDRGHRATLFVIPRTAEVQADVLGDLWDAGAELGMHMHPQTTDYGVDAHLGQLSPTRQRKLLESGCDRIEAALGEPPRAFRPGCFSASDDTFSILADLGFTHGSVSLPGRRLPDYAAKWVDSVPFAHWASATDRLRAGELPFLEMPTAVDLREVAGPKTEAGDATQLRLERAGIEQWGPGLIRRHLRRQIEEDWWLKSMVVMTHNTREYEHREEPARRALETVADEIESAADEVGLSVIPATLAEVRAAVKRPAD